MKNAFISTERKKKGEFRKKNRSEDTAWAGSELRTRDCA